MTHSPSTRTLTEIALAHHRKQQEKHSAPNFTSYYSQFCAECIALGLLEIKASVDQVYACWEAAIPAAQAAFWDKQDQEEAK